MTEDKIKVIQGEMHADERGFITSLNDFHFDGVRRSYFIHHPDDSVVRGWHAHQNERKWYSCLHGKFSVACVKVDDWNNPSADLKAEIFHLDDKNSRLVCVPKGYACCLKAWEPDSVMLVLSDKILEEALLDSWRYPKEMWVDWTKNRPE